MAAPVAVAAAAAPVAVAQVPPLMPRVPVPVAPAMATEEVPLQTPGSAVQLQEAAQLRGGQPIECTDDTCYILWNKSIKKQ